jgi:hypothetical protein
MHSVEAAKVPAERERCCGFDQGLVYFDDRKRRPIPFEGVGRRMTL